MLGSPPSLDEKPGPSTQALLPQPSDHEHTRIRIPHLPEAPTTPAAEIEGLSTAEIEPGDHAGDGQEAQAESPSFLPLSMASRYLGVPNLPLEVLALVFEILYYDDDRDNLSRTGLCACALVSKTFCTLVQPLLFKSIMLDVSLEDEDADPDGEDISEVHSLVSLFRQSPHLGRYVREISVGYRSMSSPEFTTLMEFIPNLYSFDADGYDEGSSAHSTRGEHFIASVIYCKHHILPKLTTFKLSSFWQIPDENLDLLQKLRHLEITETDLSPEKGVTGAPSTILRNWEDKDDGHRTEIQHPLTHITYGLPAVSFDGCEQGLVNWIKRHNCRPTSLRIFSPNNYAEQHERKAAYNLLEACASSVEKVEMYNVTTSHHGDAWTPTIAPESYRYLRHYLLSFAPPLPPESLKVPSLPTPLWISLVLERGPSPPLLERVELELDASLIGNSKGDDAGFQRLDATLTDTTRLPCLKEVIWRFRSVKGGPSAEDAEVITRKGLAVAQQQGVIQFKPLP